MRLHRGDVDAPSLEVVKVDKLKMFLPMEEHDP